MLLLFFVMAAPVAGARTIDTLSVASKSQRLEAPNKEFKPIVHRLPQRLTLANKSARVSKRTRQSSDASQMLTTPVSMVSPAIAQLRVCEFPLRSRFFHDEDHVGLRCDDRISDQPTALDGFARMQYHLSFPR